MKMQDVLPRFPHLPEQIFQKLNNESLSKCREATKSWKNIIDGKNYPWLRIVDIPRKLKKGNTYLHLAAESGHIEAFKEALSEEEDKNMKNKSFHLACKNGRTNIVQLLLKYTELEVDWIDLNAKTKNGYTAFHWACIRGHLNIIGFLMENAAALDINLNATTKSGKTAFHLACKRSTSDVVKIFMKKASNLSLDFNAKTKNGNTALHWTCIKGHSDIIKTLMEYAPVLNIDLNAKTHCGQTAFHLACQRSHSEAVKIFMQNAADFSIDFNAVDDNGFTGFLFESVLFFYVKKFTFQIHLFADGRCLSHRET
mgnify:CR=1 FL=1